MSTIPQAHFTRWIIILLLTITALSAGYGVVNLLLLRRSEQFTTVQQTASSTTDVPVVVALPTAGILSLQWFEHNHTYAGERLTQVRGIANQVGIPLAPTQLQAIDTTLGNRVLVVWSQPLGQLYDGIEIARSRDGTIQKQTVVSTQPLPPTGEWFDLTVDNDQTYYYRLRSYRLAEEQTSIYSDWSEAVSVIPTDSTPPATPLIESVTSLADQSGLLVTWQPSASTDVVSYTIYRSTEAGVLGDKVLHTADASVTSARDTTVQPGVPYYYAVTAVDAAGNESSTTTSVGTFGNPVPFINVSSNGS
ncbi:MAG TPA: hypothetical protein DEG44_02600 [Candidatus Kerfeldbacteria bacterium]|nr:hypothetical protein [Candidatus Kerfeldbacteria bacterium]